MKQAEIHFHQTTTLTPEQYVAGLTDFGPGRSKLFGNSADDYLKVHQRAFGGRCDRSSGGHLGTAALRLVDLNRVVLKTTDSKRVGDAHPATRTTSRVTKRHNRR